MRWEQEMVVTPKEPSDNYVERETSECLDLVVWQFSVSLLNCFMGFERCNFRSSISKSLHFKQ